ncbi:hypothetical protein [Actinomadura sp. WMMA1423]|uniref:hypothetical protein n=1 Tax=Actinomadura sp. WMMA1423 TaxID=2591108 RepID=UPI001147A1DF|nr:hypothetical protein [Actinomadura sp. WMMA1423]
MAETRIHHAELRVPTIPNVRIHHAELRLPQAVEVRVHHAEVVLPAAPTATVGIHYAALTLPAGDQDVVPSGIRQLGGNDAWWDLELRQRTSTNEWT